MIVKRIKRKIFGMLPRAWQTAYQVIKKIEVGYGHFNSSKQFMSLGRDGEPVPWYTYPAIDFIKQLDLSDKTVFEYGCGNSSVFWGGTAEKVISVESDEKWYQSMLPQIKDGNLLIFEKDMQKYAECIEQFDKFDIIVIDGRNRLECAKRSIKQLKPDGFIILDNSERDTEVTNFLNKCNFIQVDMIGFGPINGYMWATSFFFSRDVELKNGLTNRPLID